MKDLSKLEQKQLRHLMQARKEKMRWEEKDAAELELGAESDDVGLRESMIRQIAKNVSQLVIVGSFGAPPLELPTLDRWLLLAEVEELEVLLCLNKIDLLAQRSEGEKIARLYRKLNYPVILSSTSTGEGFAELRHSLEKKHSVVVGPHGVGKSSLLRALDPAYEQKQNTRPLTLQTAHGEAVSCVINDYKFSHVTEVVEVNGSNLHEHVRLPHEEVHRYFPEFFEPSRECAQEGCLHIHEDDCGVMQAVAEGKIAKARHTSYVNLVTALR